MPKKRPISRKNWSAEQLREEFTEEEEKWQQQDCHFVARVVEVHKGFLYVSPEENLYEIKLHDVWLATIPKRFFLAEKSSRKLLAVGDRVLCQKHQHNLPQDKSDLPTCQIIRKSPRRNSISRVDKINPNLSHTITANVDNLLIVVSLASPPPSFSLIDRYLVLADKEKIKATIIFNKKDLLAAQTSDYRQKIENKINYYQNLAYPSLVVQANLPNCQRNAHTQKLQTLLSTGISVLTGHSGVGKSSLVNLFSPAIIQCVEEHDLYHGGRHTTTYASLLGLQTGGYVVDTPGVKRFALMKIPQIELTSYFREFASHQADCRYRACLHENEPVCGIKDAVANGEISEERYNSYLAILQGHNFNDW